MTIPYGDALFHRTVRYASHDRPNGTRKNGLIISNNGAIILPNFLLQTDLLLPLSAFALSLIMIHANLLMILTLLDSMLFILITED